MKELGLIFVMFSLMLIGYCAGKAQPNSLLVDEKTALEIKVLQHELKAYEEMDKELAE